MVSKAASPRSSPSNQPGNTLRYTICRSEEFAMVKVAWKMKPTRITTQASDCATRMLLTQDAIPSANPDIEKPKQAYKMMKIFRTETDKEINQQLRRQSLSHATTGGHLQTHRPLRVRKHSHLTCTRRQYQNNGRNNGKDLHR